MEQTRENLMSADCGYIYKNGIIYSRYDGRKIGRLSESK